MKNLQENSNFLKLEWIFINDKLLIPVFQNHYSFNIKEYKVASKVCKLFLIQFAYTLYF